MTRVMLDVMRATALLALTWSNATSAQAPPPVALSVAGDVDTPMSLAELDPALTTNDIMVADTLDGKPILAAQGPWRIVAPKESRASRSVRMLQRLEVVRLRK